jgi:2Fe-2S ferredoxin
MNDESGEYHILVMDHDGEVHDLIALEGWRIMEIIRDWGLPIKAECGGACACATCHVYVDESWLDKLAPPRDEEIERLDEAFDVRPNSRLSCQILFSPELNGLSVTLAPDGN